MQRALLIFLLSIFSLHAVADWPQGSGPHGNFSAPNSSAPTEWSAVQSKNILWRKTLPETGQSTVSIHGNKAFFTTMEPVEADSKLGSNIEAWCVDANHGETLWKKPIKGKHPLRLSGCFSDSSSPPPVTDGKLVVFTNASGTLSAFTLEGQPVWQRELLVVGRTQPFLYKGNLITTRQIYAPVEGKFGHNHKNAPLEDWTQLIAIDFATGEDRWASRCGVNMGCVPLLQTLNDGMAVAVVGRGGGHSPPEKPEGISLVNLDNGDTIWSIELKGFMATQTYPIRNDEALIFHNNYHLRVNATTGIVTHQTPIAGADVQLCGWNGENYETKTTPLVGSKKRNITQQSNVLAGDYHYFRCYTKNWLGRVNLKTNQVEYLELPLQIKRTANGEEILHMPTKIPTFKDKKGREKPLPFNQIAFAKNDMKNSRGWVVVGDDRSHFNGWGHYSSAVPTLIGENLYIPTMSGSVFVIKAHADKLDGKAIVAMNDLGPIGEAWNRASLSAANGKLYAHTIKEILCIGTTE